MSEIDIDLNLALIQQRIELATQDAGRTPNSVRLLAVSKTQPAAAVAIAAVAGQQAFGENYVQEGVDKILALAPLNLALEWHFIGPLQSNKTRLVAEHFAWVHSIERLKIAERLAQQRPSNLPPLQVCVQVNVSGEASKSGCALEAAAELCHAVACLPNLRLRGLMAIPAPAPDFAAQCQDLRKLQTLFLALQEQGLPLDTLSMGMSDDLEAAIACGATLVRIGTAIFGARQRVA